jgi:hypothetical protein
MIPKPRAIHAASTISVLQAALWANCQKIIVDGVVNVHVQDVCGEANISKARLGQTEI